jgi:hypothetical protein
MVEKQTNTELLKINSVGSFTFQIEKLVVGRGGIFKDVANREVCTGFWWGNLRDRDHWRDLDVDGRIILRWTFGKWEGVVGTGWSCLRIVTGGGHL